MFAQYRGIKGTVNNSLFLLFIWGGVWYNVPKGRAKYAQTQLPSSLEQLCLGAFGERSERGKSKIFRASARLRSKGKTQSG